MPQNLTFPVQPDPISGMHCWHQKVTLQKAEAGKTAMATCSWTRNSPTRSTSAGWPRLAADPAPAACAGRCG